MSSWQHDWLCHHKSFTLVIKCLKTKVHCPSFVRKLFATVWWLFIETPFPDFLLSRKRGVAYVTFLLFLFISSDRTDESLSFWPSLCLHRPPGCSSKWSAGAFIGPFPSIRATVFEDGLVFLHNILSPSKRTRRAQMCRCFYEVLSLLNDIVFEIVVGFLMSLSRPALCEWWVYLPQLNCCSSEHYWNSQ